MDLRGQEIKNTYGNVVTVGSSAGAPTTGELTNGQNTSFTSTYLGGNFGIGSAPTAYGSLNVLGIGSAASAGGAIIDIVGTSGRLASIYTEASGKLVLTADPTNAQAGTAMEFNVDGSNAMFIDSSQRVGIGTTSPSNLLTVSGTGYIFNLSGGGSSRIAGAVNNTSGNLEFGLEGSVGNQLFNGAAAYGAAIGTSVNKPLHFATDTTVKATITSDGNVGIGTTSPSTKLHVADSAAVGVNVTSSASQAYMNFTSVNTAGFEPFIGFGGTSAGDQTQMIGIVNGGVRWTVAGTERMRITSTGNVGIGTSSPSQKLSVNGIAAVLGGNQLRLYRTDNATYGSIEYLTGAGGFKFDDANGDGYTFAQGANTWLTITSAGNVGIGTTSPSQKLHIDGSARITGAIYDSNNAAGTSGQVLSSTGTGTDWVSLSEISGVDGTGTANYISKWSDTDTITNSQIQDDGTTVGIGQAPSTAKLTVSGDIQTAAPETTTASAWKLGNVGLGGVFVGAADYVTISVGGLVVKLPIAIFPETQDYYDRVIADGGTFEGLLGYESAVTILKAE